MSILHISPLLYLLPYSSPKSPHCPHELLQYLLLGLFLPSSNLSPFSAHQSERYSNCVHWVVPHPCTVPRIDPLILGSKFALIALASRIPRDLAPAYFSDFISAIPLVLDAVATSQFLRHPSCFSLEGLTPLPAIGFLLLFVQLTLF